MPSDLIKKPEARDQDRSKGVILAALLMTIGTGVCSAVAAVDLSGREIMERNFTVTKVRTLHADYTMTLINDKGQERIRKMSAVSLLQSNGLDTNLLTRFIFPGDLRGTGFLQLQHHKGEDDLWVYLPGLKKTRRLVARNKRDSFFGSEFSFGDFLLPVVDLYRHTFLRREKVNGDPCVVVESIPATDQIASDYGYAKKISWIAESNFHERRVEYYDLQQRLLKVQEVLSVKPIQGEPSHWWAWRREMRNVQTGYRTLIEYERMNPKGATSADWFTPQYLARGG